MEGLIYVGNLHFKIDWANLVVGTKFTVFALFYFVFEGSFQVQAPQEAYIGGTIQQKVLCITSLGGLYLEGLIQRGAYFQNFTALCGRTSRASVIINSY